MKKTSQKKPYEGICITLVSFLEKVDVIMTSGGADVDTYWNNNWFASTNDGQGSL